MSKSTLLATRPSRLAPKKCINKSIWLATGGHLPWVHHEYLPGANQIDLFMHFFGYDHRRGGLIWTRFLLVTRHMCGHRSFKDTIRVDLKTLYAYIYSLPLWCLCTTRESRTDSMIKKIHQPLWHMLSDTLWNLLDSHATQCSPEHKLYYHFHQMLSKCTVWVVSGCCGGKTISGFWNTDTQLTHYPFTHLPFRVLTYSLPSVNVNPREWIKVNIYRGVNS